MTLSPTIGEFGEYLIYSIKFLLSRSFPSIIIKIDDSLLNSKTGHSKSNKLKDAALDYALTNRQNNDVAGLEIANSIQAAEANKTNEAWTGTSMSYAGGTLLNEAQRKYFANLNMDIKPV